VGASTPDDGRLDYDDLVGALDGAGTVDVVAAGDEDRLTDRFASSRLGRRVRRHRVTLLAASAACLVVIGTGAAAESLIPPPLDRQIRLTPTAALPQAERGETLRYNEATDVIRTATGGLHRAAYFLRPIEASDTDHYRVISLVGSGIGTSSASQTESGEGVFIANVAALLDCVDERALSQQGEGFALLVERTDQFERTWIGQVPLPETAGWPAHVIDRCARERAETDIQLSAVATATADHAFTLRLDLTISSDLPVGSSVTARDENDDTANRVTTTTVELAPWGTATLSTNLEVRDCDANSRHGGTRQLVGGNNPGISLGVRVPSSRETSVFMPWPEAAATQIADAVSSLCAGVPAATVTVTRALFTGDASGNAKHADVTLLVKSVGTAVTVAPLYEMSAMQFAPLRKGTSSGRAVVRVRLNFDCEALGTPPSIRLTVRARGQWIPFAASLIGPPLTEAVAAACSDTVTEDDLVQNGWARPT
jgi:hypothetical protein